MTYVPPPGALKTAAAEVLKALDRPIQRENGQDEPSGFDDDFVDMIAEDYEYFLTPDQEFMARKEVDRNLDRMLTAADSLLDTLRRSRDNGLTDAFHKVEPDYIFDRYKPTMDEFERWVEKLTKVAKACREKPGIEGRRVQSRPTQIAIKVADDFRLLTRAEPTLSNKIGQDYCMCVARIFAVLRIEANPVSYARKVIEMRKLGSVASS